MYVYGIVRVGLDNDRSIMDRDPAGWTINVPMPPLGEKGERRFPPAGGCGPTGPWRKRTLRVLNNSHDVALWRVEVLPRWLSLGPRTRIYRDRASPGAKNRSAPASLARFVL